MIFKSWDSIAWLFATLLVTYPSLIILLRWFGKRSLAKMNMFDFIITVALGSTFASVVVTQSISIMDGLAALGLMLLAQFIITWVSMKSPNFNHLIKSEASLLFHDGHFLDEEMQSVRVTKEEIFAEIRQKGFACLSDVYAVVLENNGEISVLGHSPHIENSTLHGVKNYTVGETR